MLTPSPYKLNEYSETPLDDLLHEMSQEREPFTEPEPKSETLIDDQSLNVSQSVKDAAPLPDDKIVLTEKEKAGKREFTARFLGKNTDKAFAFLAAMIAESDDTEEWKANPDDLKDIIECYYEMCVGYGWLGLPPWLNLVLCLSFTYAPAFREAYKVRGINKEITRKAAQALADKIIAEENLKRIKEQTEKQPPVADIVRPPAETKTTEDGTPQK